MVLCQVRIKLTLNDPLDNFGYNRDYRYRSKVRRVGKRTRLVDWMNNGVLPDVRKVVAGQTGIDDVQ